MTGETEEGPQQQPERFGPYELVSLLGRGGMGDVYRAYDTARKRTVALKRLPRHLAGDEAYETRFRREAEVAARLTEPHIIPIHDYGEIGGQLYIDMRLISGTDLGEVIARSGPLAPERAVAIIGQVASALAAAHAEGLVHRDVKPSNILISTTDRGDDFVHLVDFGIVHERNATALTATGATIGTIDYMAPERLQQEDCDHRVDVYALGCVLYEALTGSKPFPAGSTAGKMYAHMHTPPPRPSQSRPELPPGLDDVVATAMAKHPQERHASTTELATSAFRSLTGTPPRPAGRSGTGVVTTLRPGATDPMGPRTASGWSASPATGLPAPAASPTQRPNQAGYPSHIPAQHPGQAPAPHANQAPHATRPADHAPPATRLSAPPPSQPPHPARPAEYPPPYGPPGRRDDARPSAGRRLAPLLVLGGVVVVAIVVATVLFTRSGTGTDLAATPPTPSVSAGATSPAPDAVSGATSPAGGDTPSGQSVQAAAPPPAGSGGTTTITDLDGRRTTVSTDTLQICSGDTVPFSSGQAVRLATVSKLAVTSAGATGEALTLTLTDGQTVSGRVTTGCSVTGENSVGTFTLDLGKIATVEIGR